MDKPNNDKDCFADRPDPRTEDLWKPPDVPTSTQLQDQSTLMQNWTRNDERLAVDFPRLKIGGPAGSKADSGEPSMDVDGRPSDRTIRPGDAMPRRIDYEALAKQITDSSKIPESIENALKNGVGHPGLDLDELNKVLGPKGLYIDKTAMKTGLMAILYKNGEVADCVVAKTPAAKEIADKILRVDGTKISNGCSDLAKEMIDDGISPQCIKKALENGVGGPGIDLEELNSILGPKGFYFELNPSENGLRANLHQNGEVIDFVNVRTPEARKIALIGSVQSSDSCPVPAGYSLPGGGNVPILDRTSIVKALATGAEVVNSALYRENKVVKALATGALKGLK